MHDSAYIYKVNLVMYFDEVNGNPSAEDAFVRVAIFRKFDNQLMDTLFMPKTVVSNVPYSFPDCSIPELKTKRITYSAKIELPPNDYNDFGGYYISWDRCCRNNTISNLITPGAQGQTFYVEFPPVSVAGQQFINSSPVLFPPVSDYACRDELFYFDFRGSDPDGDSLVYSLSEPLRGFSSVNNPNFLIPFPGPYPTVIWQTGFNLNSMIPGNPPLQISPTGFITVKPTFNGLFVFAVKCEEFRNGQKIGEIRRDFQIIVRDCPSNEQPQISVENPADSSLYLADDTLYFDLNNRCFDIYLKDADPGTTFDVEINALNFDPSEISVTPENGLLPNGDSLKARVCFNKCAYSENEPYLFEIILSDDGCSLPKKDTVIITAIVDAIPDLAPAINSNFIGDSIILEVGEPFMMTINGFDSDNDTIVLNYGQNAFTPSDYGMQLNRVQGAGQVSSTFTWTPTCKALELNGEELNFRVFDYVCSNFKSELAYPIKIISDNKKPTLISDIPDAVVDFDIRKPVEFRINASDTNVNDILLLKLTISDTTGIQLRNLDYELTPLSAKGSLESIFTWEPGCEFLDIGTLQFDFTVQDNGCDRKESDLNFKARFVYENEAPNLVLNNPVDGKKNYSVNIYTDSIIALDFSAEDRDLDQLEMRWERISEPGENLLPIAFQSTGDFGFSEGRFEIGPGTCSASGFYKEDFYIIVKESSCENLEDTIQIEVNVKEFYKELKVPNVFTPNGDGINDFFYPEQLPKKCQFVDIEIYNRWGRKIFESSEADFRWDAADVPAGDYFYLIQFENTNYKGIIKVLK